MNDKTMYFANFNITFGENESPMLEYFEDIIFPAFTADYVRGKPSEPQYFFRDVKISEIDDDYLLVGNYIKSTHYEVYTTIQNNELIGKRSNIPTAPYSRFIIFLKNHRMVLVKNEPSSPDIRSFQLTFNTILKQYLRQQRRKTNDKNKYPQAKVNIVDIPSKENLEKQLENVSKIQRMQVRLFPLNNDLDASPVLDDIRTEMKKLGSSKSSIQFNSPKNKSGIYDFVDTSSGLASIQLFVTDTDGTTKKIENDKFSAHMKIPADGNITPSMDERFIEYAKKNPTICEVSSENSKLYTSISKKGIFEKIKEMFK